MSVTFPSRSDSLRLAVALCCASLVCFLAFDCAAQSRRPGAGLPRVGTIKDYPATGLMTGCGNLYFSPAVKTSSSPDAFIFLARGDGSDAWMNLSGRDVRLQQIKWRGHNGKQPRGYHYRFGTLQVTVLIEDFKPKNAPVAESDAMFKMKITLIRGRARRVVLAVGDADC